MAYPKTTTQESKKVPYQKAPDQEAKKEPGQKSLSEV